MPVAFVEKKMPDFRRVESLLDQCARANRWANRGPLYTALTDALTLHATPNAGTRFVPVANGGIALEAMARLLSQHAGKRLRWAASAFSFKNLGRGYFHDCLLLDCDAQGLIDLEACSALDPSAFDGLIVTNPFGLHMDFTRFAAFAKRQGKLMLIDNASGFHSHVPDWPWQAFSLHHTKPYGVGEGGAALVPDGETDALYALVDYASDQQGSPHWLGNGKLSDICCAFLVDRLERVAEWAPLYLEQRQRVVDLAAQAGFTPLATPPDGLAMTSLPLLAPTALGADATANARSVVLGKYYKPLSPRPRIDSLFERLINLPCHPDMATLSDSEVLEDLERVLTPRGAVLAQ